MNMITKAFRYLYYCRLKKYHSMEVFYGDGNRKFKCDICGKESRYSHGGVDISFGFG